MMACVKGAYGAYGAYESMRYFGDAKKPFAPTSISTRRRGAETRRWSFSLTSWKATRGRYGPKSMRLVDSVNIQLRSEVYTGSSECDRCLHCAFDCTSKDGGKASGMCL